MDGNFKVSQTIFAQVYIIRAKLDQGSVSCMYAFLPGKDHHFYVELFQALQVNFNQTCFKKVNDLDMYVCMYFIDLKYKNYFTSRMV